MPVELTEDQIQDLRDIDSICRQMKVEFVIVGATAYQLYFKDADRFTADIDKKRFAGIKGCCAT